jgi:hypothetical protein
MEAPGADTSRTPWALATAHERPSRGPFAHTLQAHDPRGRIGPDDEVDGSGRRGHGRPVACRIQERGGLPRPCAGTPFHLDRACCDGARNHVDAQVEAAMRFRGLLVPFVKLGALAITVIAGAACGGGGVPMGSGSLSGNPRLQLKLTPCRGRRGRSDATADRPGVAETVASGRNWA